MLPQWDSTLSLAKGRVLKVAQVKGKGVNPEGLFMGSQEVGLTHSGGDEIYQVCGLTLPLNGASPDVSAGQGAGAGGAMARERGMLTSPHSQHSPVNVLLFRAKGLGHFCCPACGSSVSLATSPF